MLTTMIGRRFLPAAFESLIRSRVSPERGDEPGVAQGLGGPEAVGRWKAGTGVCDAQGFARTPHYRCSPGPLGCQAHGSDEPISRCRLPSAGSENRALPVTGAWLVAR